MKAVLSEDGLRLDSFVNFIEDFKSYVTDAILNQLGERSDELLGDYVHCVNDHLLHHL